MDILKSKRELICDPDGFWGWGKNRRYKYIVETEVGTWEVERVNDGLEGWMVATRKPIQWHAQPSILFNHRGFRTKTDAIMKISEEVEYRRIHNDLTKED